MHGHSKNNIHQYLVPTLMHCVYVVGVKTKKKTENKKNQGKKEREKTKISWKNNQIKLIRINYFLRNNKRKNGNKKKKLFSGIIPHQIA